MFEQWAADPRLIVDRKSSMMMGNHGLTYQTRLENRGELDAVQVDGGRVPSRSTAFIVVSSSRWSRATSRMASSKS